MAETDPVTVDRTEFLVAYEFVSFGGFETLDLDGKALLGRAATGISDPGHHKTVSLG